MSAKVKQEVALAYGTIVAGVEAANALIALPVGVQVAVAVLGAMLGALGIRQNVVPMRRARP